MTSRDYYLANIVSRFDVPLEVLRTGSGSGELLICISIRDVEEGREHEVLSRCALFKCRIEEGHVRECVFESGDEEAGIYLRNVLPGILRGWSIEKLAEAYLEIARRRLERGDVQS